jgi:hypothetical protein
MTSAPSVNRLQQGWKCGWAVGGPAAFNPLVFGFQPNSRQGSEPTNELPKSGFGPFYRLPYRAVGLPREGKAEMGSRPRCGRRPTS